MSSPQHAFGTSVGNDRVRLYFPRSARGFDLFDKPATFRAQVASVNDGYGYSNIGEGFDYNQPRRFQMSLTVIM